MDLSKRVDSLVRNYNVTREEAKTAVSERDQFRKETYCKKPLSDYASGWHLTSNPENPDTLAVQVNLLEIPPEGVTLPIETLSGRRIWYKCGGKINSQKND